MGKDFSGTEYQWLHYDGTPHACGKLITFAISTYQVLSARRIRLVFAVAIRTARDTAKAERKE